MRQSVCTTSAPLSRAACRVARVRAQSDATTPDPGRDGQHRQLDGSLGHERADLAVVADRHRDRVAVEVRHQVPRLLGRELLGVHLRERGVVRGVAGGEHRRAGLVVGDEPGQRQHVGEVLRTRRPDPQAGHDDLAARGRPGAARRSPAGGRNPTTPGCPAPAGPSRARAARAHAARRPPTPAPRPRTRRPARRPCRARRAVRRSPARPTRRRRARPPPRRRVPPPRTTPRAPAAAARPRRRRTRPPATARQRAPAPGSRRRAAPPR